eukprot:gb/GEZN01014185.1/.p1 GENE.gb/GEZN01014185.1/~~gb/GEZN01014185.1/.p1  ORF type:complete len:280 (-),score=17.81 gb/GEZN01014185.1/:129-944(-)
MSNPCDSSLSSCPTPDVEWTSGMDYTESMGNVSCVAWIYPLHIAFAYVVILSGLGAMITRVLSSAKWLHVWFGRIFMVAYYYATWTSILIYKTGLPRAIIVFMTVMFNALAIGYFAIKFHQGGNYEDPKRTWRQRYFSWKSLHGSMMFIAWWQMAGRAGVTNVFFQFECDTIPVYKDDPRRMPIQQHDPDKYGGMSDSRFAMMALLPCFILVLGGGLLGSWYYANRDQQEDRQELLANQSSLSDRPPLPEYNGHHEHTGHSNTQNGQNGHM